MMENFPNLMTGKNHTNPGSREGPNQEEPKKPTQTHIIIKMAKFKDRIFKAAREKQKVTYKGALIRLATDFSAETLQARRE